MQVYLDIDGVLADFTSAAFKVHGREWDKDGEEVRWNFFLDWGMPEDHFWNVIDAEGPAFWENLEPYPWFHELVDLAAKCGEVRLLTSPSRHHNSVTGKIKWIHKHFGLGFRHWIMCPEHKEQLCRGPRCVLIDDRIENIDRWGNAGGIPILFPQKWNALANISHKPMSFVKAAMKGLTHA
jgi:5'(3')-deoxyribonucleotidase